VQLLDSNGAFIGHGVTVSPRSRKGKGIRSADNAGNAVDILDTVDVVDTVDAQQKNAGR
jgi:hypothetical protein